MTRAVLILAVVSSLTVRSGAAQLPAPPGQVSAAPSFEVASIRPNTSGLTSQSSRTGRGSMTTTNMRVRALIVLAYGTRPERIVGAPSWIDQERFDIAARARADTPDDQLRLMLRTLLAERFRLVVRSEMREQPIYALVHARADGTLGPNLKPSAECDAAGVTPTGASPPATPGSAGLAPGKRPCTVFSGGDGRGAYVTGGARSIDALVRALEGLTERPVVNRTGLAGTYDFDLRFSAAPLAPPVADVPTLPSIFTAIQEQLGLRLEPARGPVEFLAIESIERPTPD